MTFEEEPAGEDERAAAIAGWVVAFDREMEQTGDFAASVAVMTVHGCFDVRAVVERWILANPTGDAIAPQPCPAPQVAEAQQPVAEDVPALAEAVATPEPSWEALRTKPRLEPASSPDIAYFHSLLQGGIDRAQIDEAFPAFRLVIDEAVGQHEAAAPILSDVPAAPSREDLNDEIRGMRQEFQAPPRSGRRRWRTRG
jgi:hypothetical protein